MKTISLIALSVAFAGWDVVLPDLAAAQAEPPICSTARNARARGSPAAPGLERQCAIAVEAQRPAPPPVPLGRVQTPTDPSSGKPPVPLGRVQRTPSGPFNGPAGQTGGGENPSDRICQVGGVWQLYQSNDSVVEVTIEQQGNSFHGDGRFGSMRSPRDFGITIGVVENGLIAGREVSFRVRWADGHIGIYKGMIGDAGLLEGEGYDFTSPSSTAKWYASRNFTC